MPRRVLTPIYPDVPHPSLDMFILDTGKEMVLEAWTRRYGILLHREVHYGNWRVWPLVGARRNIAVSKFIQKALAKAGEAANASYRDDDLKRDCPAVMEFLTDTDDGQGGRRKTATLSVFAADGQFKVFLNDRQTMNCLCVASESLWGALQALEAALQSDQPGWRRMEPQEAGKHQTRKPPRP